jgi:hypothetical protein
MGRLAVALKYRRQRLGDIPLMDGLSTTTFTGDTDSYGCHGDSGFIPMETIRKLIGAQRR